MPEVTRLKSTNERVIVLGEHKNPKTGEEMLHVKMEPQHSWHKPRFQDVLEENTVTQKTN